MKPVRALAALGLLLAGPSFAQTAPVTAPAPAAAAAATIPADPALWVVKDKDTTIYLFGTIHVLKPGLSWFDAAVKQAFDKSDQLILEIPLPDQATAQKVLLPLAVDTSGKPLTGKLPEDKRAIYAKAMTSLGLAPAAFDQFQPWFAAISMTQVAVMKAGYNPENGVERQLDLAAKAENKPVTGLETLEQQLGYFHDLPEKDQIAFLASSAAEIGDTDSKLGEMIGDWAKGDPDHLGALLNDDIASEPHLYQVLLTDRNARWTDWIHERLKQPGTIFIAVGAGHLAGPNSVQAQLAAKYHVQAQRISY